MHSQRHRRYRFADHGSPFYPSSAGSRGTAGKSSSLVVVDSVEDIDFDRIIDHENLLAALEGLACDGGEAPGPDGITYSDLSRRERTAVIREVSRALKNGSWRPGPARACHIPKPGGGTRTLKMRNITDRVVSKAVTAAITPALDALMDAGSMGFRPGRCHLRLLAQLASQMERGDRWFVAHDDIRKAFDNVPLELLTEHVRENIPYPRLVTLIETIARGEEGACRQVGLDQGDPLSPLLLNLLLTFVLDRPTRSACPDTPFWRYADNIICASQNESEARSVMEFVHSRLRDVGFDLKGLELANLNRNGMHTQLLGFSLQRKGNKIMFSPGKAAWQHLTSALRTAHEAPRPAKSAQKVCEGWIQGYGPVFENAGNLDVILMRVRTCARQNGFEEIGMSRLRQVASRSRVQWEELREREAALTSCLPLGIACESSHGTDHAPAGAVVSGSD